MRPELPDVGSVFAVVTGAAGFVGAHLVERLFLAGARVVGIDRLAPVTPPFGRHILGDLLDSEAAAAAIREADVVFHLAGRPGVRDRAPGTAAARRRDNVAAGGRVLDLARNDAVVVVASSSSVYGGAAGRPCREDDPLRPLGGYARSKVMLERLATKCRERGRAVVVARPFTVAGPGQRPDMALARWIAAARAGDPIRVFGSLDRTRDVTAVDDVVSGLHALAGVPGAGVVNLGTGRPLALRELVAAVRSVVTTESPVAVEPVSSEEPASTWADTERCRRALGWCPETDLSQLVAAQASVLHSQVESANMA